MASSLHGGDAGALTATGHAAAGQHLVRWHGDVPAGQETANPLTFTWTRRAQSPPSSPARPGSNTPATGHHQPDGTGGSRQRVPPTLSRLQRRRDKRRQGAARLTPPISNSGVTQPSRISGNTAPRAALPDTVQTWRDKPSATQRPLTNVVPFLRVPVTSVVTTRSKARLWRATSIWPTPPVARFGGASAGARAFTARLLRAKPTRRSDSRMFEAVPTQKEIFWNLRLPHLHWLGATGRVNAGWCASTRRWACKLGESWPRRGFSSMTPPRQTPNLRLSRRPAAGRDVRSRVKAHAPVSC